MLLKFYKLIFSLLVIASLAGCATTNSEGGKDFKVNIKAAQDINPTAEAANSPIAITVYQLKTPEEFANASYLDISQSKIPSIIDHKTWVVWPSKGVQETMSLWPQTRYLGIVASYANLNNKRWKLIQTMGWFTSSIGIQVMANGINED